MKGRIIASTFAVLLGTLFALIGIISGAETAGIGYIFVIFGFLLIFAGLGIEGSFFKALPYLTGRKK